MFPDVLPVSELTTYVVRYFSEGLRRLVPEQFHGGTFTLELLLNAGGVLLRYSGLIQRYIALLQREGVIEEVKGSDRTWRWRRPLQPAREPEKSDSPELVLIKHCGEHLPELLKGEIHPGNLFSVSPCHEALTALYRETSIASTANDTIRRLLQALINDRESSSFPLRIMELGAGTGRLDQRSGSFIIRRYSALLFSDISETLLEQSRRMFKDYGFMDFLLFDINHPPEDQNITSARWISFWQPMPCIPAKTCEIHWLMSAEYLTLAVY